MENVKEINEFLDVYIHESSISEIIYNVKQKKWILIFNDKSKLEFENFNQMGYWLHIDQYGM